MNSQEYYEAIVSDPNMLEHYGVLGMKWGIRRYQNPDGSLTSLGKKHMEDGKTQKAIDKFNQKKSTAIAVGDKKFVEKNLDYMTNEDINKFNERLRARNTINNLKKEAQKITAEKLQTWTDTASRIINNTANTAESAIRVYNAMARAHNTFFKNEKKWNVVENNQNKDDDKKKGGKNDQTPSLKEVWRNGQKESRYEVRYENGQRIEKEEHFKTDKSNKDNKDSGSNNSLPKAAQKGIADIDKYNQEALEELRKKKK